MCYLSFSLEVAMHTSWQSTVSRRQKISYAFWLLDKKERLLESTEIKRVLWREHDGSRVPDPLPQRSR